MKIPIHMKMKSILLLAMATLGWKAATMAQSLPSYLPANGLVGWYPFNGNANDESLLGTNGIVSNATLSFDRFNNPNSSYNFNGVNAIIDLGINNSINTISSELTFLYWVKPDGNSQNASMTVLASYAGQGGSGGNWRFISRVDRSTLVAKLDLMINSIWNSVVSPQNAIVVNQWNHVVHTRSGNLGKTYINGVLINTSNIASQNINTPSLTGATTKIGFNWPSFANTEWFKGDIDDLGFYNRALAQQEITALYTASSTNTNEVANTINNVPGAISYQAVARDAQGLPLANANLEVQFSLLADSLTGIAEYTETHTLTTNQFGLFTTAFGAGTSVSGTFSGINWSAGNKYLHVQMDTGGGWVDMGTQQLLATPYSMHSATSGAIKNPGLPVFSDNAAAIAGGLSVGEMYRTAGGVLMVVY
jgi:hypothetical protein